MCIRDRVYFAGGEDENLFAFDIIDVYDNATDSWNTLQMSTPRIYMNALVMGDYLFFGLGSSQDLSVAQTSVDIYNTITEEWTSISLSRSRMGAASAVVDGKAIFGGGYGSAAFTVRDQVDIVEAETSSTTNLLGHGELFTIFGSPTDGVITMDVKENATITLANLNGQILYHQAQQSGFLKFSAVYQM